ncbi:P-loop containing nucleoside triphosphate hydrolases superfamily protein isoform 1 [Hibiscus syriacus]|uniref:Kinesin-like protein n=1 Tax=Hibiscus syriacus TaxID=106335 RepID=A0A6A2WIV9_HIBSY|nr:P-loop containing nucleoside triphosphate hydrolases superfamily protein isoform 1 [Hibiscus syriacus]
MRNLHRGLKEKLRELTLLYEQQKKASAVLRNSSNNNVMKENTIPTTTTSAPIANSKAFDDSKENLFIGTDHKILGVSSFATKGTDTAVARKLSMEMNEKNESRIRVFVRLRLMSKKEKEVGSRCCVKIVNKKDVYLTECGDESDYLRLKRLKGKHFTFDASFPDSSTQYDVYTTTTAELVEAVLRGRNGSVFCYGATGRQNLYDGIAAAGFTQYRAYSTDEVMALLQRGNQNRITEPTIANETSSRSHAILQVVVEYRVKGASMNVINRVGKLSFIDLAGSERAPATDQSTLRSLEGANINRSLLALSSCFNALAERKTHIPYQNSKLTQLLKDSLGGACNTEMITNISPSNVSFGETQSTLHWADRTKEIQTKENRELQIQLVRQRQKLLSFQSQSIAAIANISPPTPTSLTSITTPPSTSQPAKKMKLKLSILARNFATPESRKRAAEEAVNELKLRVKALESEMARMKKTMLWN